MRPKVVVMMSTFNGESYISKQIESISRQSADADVMLFVRDDGSKDKTLEILHDWESKLNIEYIQDGLSLGAAKSFWKLLLNAPDADYYAFVDQDDIWDCNKLEYAIKAIGNTDERILWFSNCRLISSEGKIIKERKHKKQPILNVTSQLICGSAQGCAMVFNRAAFSYLKTLKIEKLLMHDIVVMEYILANGKVIFEPTPLFSYRVHSTNVVAKEGKGMITRIRGTLFQWFGKKNRYSVSDFANQVKKDNEKVLDNMTIQYIDELCKCKKSLKSRLYILKSPMTRTSNLDALRSYKIRVLLGIV